MPCRELSTETHQSNDHLTLLRKAEVARCLGVSAWTLDRWVNVGKFPPPVLPDRRVRPQRGRVSDLDAFPAKAPRRTPAFRRRFAEMLERMADEA